MDLLQPHSTHFGTLRTKNLKPPPKSNCTASRLDTSGGTVPLSNKATPWPQMMNTWWVSSAPLHSVSPNKGRGQLHRCAFLASCAIHSAAIAIGAAHTSSMLCAMEDGAGQRCAGAGSSGPSPPGASTPATGSPAWRRRSGCAAARTASWPRRQVSAALFQPTSKQKRLGQGVGRPPPTVGLVLEVGHLHEALAGDVGEALW